MRRGPAADLGRDDDLVTRRTKIAERTTQNALGIASGIDVRRVEEVDPVGDRLFDNRIGFRLIEGAQPFPDDGTFAAECVGAQTQLRHKQSGRSELAVVHRRL